MLHGLGISAAMLSLLATFDPALQSALPSAPTRRALLVGIDDYPAQNHWPKLSGPKADVAAVRAVLGERAQFRPENIQTLLDADATGTAMRQGFADMIEKSAPGDVILFYFAGHGSQVPNSAEMDLQDETLVPYDASASGEQCNDIRDDEIGKWIERANQKTDQVVLIFDCCSSGTNTRGDEPPGRRFLEPALRGFGAPRASAFRNPETTTGSGYVPPALKYVSLAACREFQSAYELQVDAADVPGHKIARGIFSYYLVEALRSLPESASYTDLMTQVIRRVNQNQSEQTPVLEGSLAENLMFQPNRAAHLVRHMLEVGENGELVLDAGRVHGRIRGDVFSVCDEETIHDSESARLGRVRLTRVESDRSAAEWLDATDAAREPGKRAAFLIERGQTDIAMRVLIDAGPEASAPEDLVQALEAKGIYRCVSMPENGLALRLIGSRWGTFTTDGLELPIAADASSQEQLVAFVRDLGRLAETERIDRLLRQDSGRAATVECVLRGVGKDQKPLDPLVPGDGGRISIEPSARWTVSVQNATDKALYVYLVAISPDGAIDLPQLATVDGAVQPGRSFQFDAMRIEEIPSQFAAFYRARPIRLHCIASSRFLDLASLEQERVTLGRTARGVTKATDDEPAVLDSQPWSDTRFEIWAR